MKSVYCFYIFVYILVLSRDTNGGLVKGFFENVHKSVQKVHNDIHNVFHPKEEPKKEAVTVADLPDKKNNENTFFFATSTPAAVNKQTNKEVVDKSVKPSESTDDSKFIFASNPTTQRVVSTTSPVTEKDGRENFTGGCSTGYERTPDGRCKPTF